MSFRSSPVNVDLEYFSTVLRLFAHSSVATLVTKSPLRPRLSFIQVVSSSLSPYQMTRHSVRIWLRTRFSGHHCGPRGLAPIGPSGDFHAGPNLA